MQAITDDVQLNRSLTQSNSIDINNIDSTKMRYLVGKGVLAPVPVAKYKYWADTVPLLTKNAYPNGPPMRPAAVTQRCSACLSRPVPTPLPVQF